VAAQSSSIKLTLPSAQVDGNVRQTFLQRVSIKLYKRSLYLLPMDESTPLVDRIKSSCQSLLNESVANALLSRKLYDSIEAIKLLRAVAETSQLPAFGAEKVPFFNRDLYHLGDLAAGAAFARALDVGDGIARNNDRAEQIYSHIFVASLNDAAAGSRFAMLATADCLIAGRGVPKDLSPERAARMALYWLLRAAGSQNPFSRAPVPADFPNVLDEIAVDSVTRLGNLFQTTLVGASDRESAATMLSLAVRHKGKDAKLSEADNLLSQGCAWRSIGERKHGEGLIALSYQILQALRASGYSRAHVMNITQFSRIDTCAGTPLERGCGAGALGKVCFSAEQKLSDIYEDIEAATRDHLSTGPLIRAYRLLVIWPGLTELRHRAEVAESIEIAVCAKSHWNNAMLGYFMPSLAERACFASDARLEAIVAFRDVLAKLIADRRKVYDNYWHSAFNSKNAVCWHRGEYALCHLLQHVITTGQIDVTSTMLDWCAIRYRLASLEDDIHTIHWRRTLIECQLASDTVVSGLQQTNAKDVRIAIALNEAIATAKSLVKTTFTRHRFQRKDETQKSSAAVANIEPEYIRRIKYQSRRSAVVCSTQEVGPHYNRLHPETGTPMPFQLLPRDKSRTEGWMRIDGIHVESRKFEIEGFKSQPGLVPLVTIDDVEVLLCCQFIEMIDQQLSLEPLGGFGQQEIMEPQFLKKEWSPDWLSETDIGRSLYYSDRLLSLEEKGYTLCSLDGKSGNALRTAEDTSIWSLPEPWRTARRVGGTTTAPSGRLMHTPFSMRWTQSNLPSGSEVKNGVGRLPMPRVTSGVVGADVVALPCGGFEDRRVGEGNLRFQRARFAYVMSKHYDAMAAAFPVFRRTRELHAINAGLYSARVHHGVQLAPPLRRRLEVLREEYRTARSRRLAAGGLDIVLR